jgi:hypothetical protein
MILTGGNGSTRRKTCPNAALAIKNLICTNVSSNLGLRGEGPATDLIHVLF